MAYSGNHIHLTAVFILIVSFVSARFISDKRTFGEWLFFSSISVFVYSIGAGVLFYKFGVSDTALAVLFGAATVTSMAFYFRRRASEAPTVFCAPRTQFVLFLILAGASAIRILLMWHTSFPLGDDSYFHCLYARSIQLAGRLIFSMAPFDPVPLKYPWGLHVGLAFASNATGAEIHQVFKFALIFYGVVSVLGIFVLARKATGSDSTALWSAFLYGMVANFGSIDYIRWSGLPNTLAMASLLAVILLALKRDSGHRTSIVWQVGLLAAIFLTHGSAVALLYGVIGTLGLVLLFRSGKKNIAHGISLFSIIVLSLVVGALIAPDIFSHLARLGKTAAAYPEKYVSIFDFPFMFSMVFTVAASAGFCLAVGRRSFGYLAVYAWVFALLSGFFVSRYAAGLISYLRTGEGAAFFQPSRFATDLVYPLSVLGGVALSWFAEKTYRIRSRLLRIGFIAAAVLLCLHEPVQHLYDKWGQVYAGREEVEAMEWIRNDTPDDSLVVNKPDAPGSYWAAYVSGRAATLILRPTLHHIDVEHGESARREVMARQALQNAVFKKKDPQQVERIMRFFPNSLFYIYSDVPINLPQADLVFKSETIYVYELKAML